MAETNSTTPNLPAATGGEGALPGYPERPRSARRANRLRARVAIALLGGEAKGPVPEAVQYLREVVAGKHPMAERTRTAAATALLRAGIDVSEPPKSGPTVDARSVTVNVTQNRVRPTIETIRAALELLKDPNFDPNGD